MDEVVLIHKPPELGDFKCKCTKSHCLKMYCECFTLGYFCSDSCGCTTCKNKEQTQDEVRNARVFIKKRNKNAFREKVKPIDETEKPSVLEESPPEEKEGPSLKAVQEQPCNCKKSNCLKGYCECFALGLPCMPGKCKCVECLNDKARPSAFDYK